MSDIPSELIREILLRLPAEPLLRFKTVCKKWLHIINDSSFIKAHTKNQPYSNTLLVSEERSGLAFYSFSLDSLEFTNGPQMIDAINTEQCVSSFDFNRSFCNGLILINNNMARRKKWVIWNPLTTECRTVRSRRYGNINGYGFGYDYDADDYKVVHIDRFDDPRKVGCQTVVYSLKLDSWRKIQDCPCNVIAGLSTFLNGTLYWPSNDTIIALSLQTESFSQLPLPPVDVTSETAFGFHLDAFDGCLICSFECNTTKAFDGWVMKDNGVEKSWTKLFSLQYSHLKVPWSFMLVAYLKRSEQVVLQNPRGFLWFDIGTNSVKKVSIHGLPDIDSSKICPGSLVRLKFGDRATRTKKKRKRTTMAVNVRTRLKFCVRDAGDMCCSINFTCRLCKEE